MSGDELKQWVVRKGGYFYRPNSQGYTSSIMEAGRYTKAEAEAEAHHCDGVRAYLAMDFMPEGKVWLILREPGCVPERKGPFLSRTLAATLREFMAARPSAFITVLSWHGESGPDVEDGPQALEMIDGRSAPTAKRHRRSTAAAFAAHHS